MALSSLHSFFPCPHHYVCSEPWQISTLPFPEPRRNPSPNCCSYQGCWARRLEAPDRPRWCKTIGCLRWWIPRLDMWPQPAQWDHWRRSSGNYRKTVTPNYSQPHDTNQKQTSYNQHNSPSFHRREVWCPPYRTKPAIARRSTQQCSRARDFSPCPQWGCWSKIRRTWWAATRRVHNRLVSMSGGRPAPPTSGLERCPKNWRRESKTPSMSQTLRTSCTRVRMMHVI